MGIYLKLYVREDRVKDWMRSEGIFYSSILMIIKKSLGYKNQEDIIKKTHLDPCFLRIKLCWKTEQEFTDLLCILNGIVKYYIDKKRYFFRGRTLLDFVRGVNGELSFLPYYKTVDENEEKSLMWFTIEKTMERWIKEKF